MQPEEWTLDTVQRFDLAVAQPAQGYRFSLDPLLLADFVSAKDDARFIDLGTGSGIIPLILCRRLRQSTSVAVDSNAAMVEVAMGNATRNNLADRMKAAHADIINLKSLFPVSTFDLVVSNPPYRTNCSGKISPKTGRDTARHESTAGLADFLSAAKYLVKPSGRICFVYHPDRLAEFIHSAAELKLSLLRLRMVHGTTNAPARIFLAELAKGRRAHATVLPPLIIYDDDGTYTREAQLILGESVETQRGRR